MNQPSTNKIEYTLKFLQVLEKSLGEDASVMLPTILASLNLMQINQHIDIVNMPEADVEQLLRGILAYYKKEFTALRTSEEDVVNHATIKVEYTNELLQDLMKNVSSLHGVSELARILAADIIWQYAKITSNLTLLEKLQ
jgi:ethanolamine ammonia-lyase large subunit